MVNGFFSTFHLIQHGHNATKLPQTFGSATGVLIGILADEANAAVTQVKLSSGGVRHCELPIRYAANSINQAGSADPLSSESTRKRLLMLSD